MDWIRKCKSFSLYSDICGSFWWYSKNGGPFGWHFKICRFPYLLYRSIPDNHLTLCLAADAYVIWRKLYDFLHVLFLWQIHWNKKHFHFWKYITTTLILIYMLQTYLQNLKVYLFCSITQMHVLFTYLEQCSMEHMCSLLGHWTFYGLLRLSKM